MGYTFRCTGYKTWQKCLELVFPDVFLWYLRATIPCLLKDYQSRRIACSKTINQGEYRESDTLAKVLWTIFFIPIIVVIMYCIIVLPEKRKDEELTRKVLEDMRRNEQIYQQNSDNGSYRKNMPNVNEDEYPW